METKRTELYTLKYKDVTFKYIIRKELSDKIYISKRPTLILVFSGKLLIKEGISEVCAKSGELVFIKSGTTIAMKEQCIGYEVFCGIYWDFGRIFLKDFYKEFEKRRRPDICLCNTESIVKLIPTVYLQSLYISLIPYIKMNLKLPVDLLSIKSQEAVYCLLSADKSLYCCLFGSIVLPKYSTRFYLN